MGDFPVEDIKLCGNDSAGEHVLEVYVKNPPHYAVYRTAKRVKINFGDDDTEEAQQRRDMARLNPLRGEINGLVDRWRGETGDAPCTDAAKTAQPPPSPSPRPPSFFTRVRRFFDINKPDPARAARNDRRVADALTVGLEGDVDGAAAILTYLKQEIIAEQGARARFYYMVTALVLTVALCLLAWVVNTAIIPDTGNKAYHFEFLPGQKFFLVAAGAGAAGAFFSVARSIRARATPVDAQSSDIIIDAALRIAVGTLSAAILVSMIASKLVGISFFNASVMQVADNTWMATLVIGFLAGFSESFVPDLLNRAAAVQAGQPAAPSPSETLKAPPATPPAAPGATSDETDEDEDGCLCDHDHDASEATPDSQLPEASGGVEDGPPPPPPPGGGEDGANKDDAKKDGGGE